MAATAFGPVTLAGDEPEGCIGKGPTQPSPTAFLGAPQRDESRLDGPTDSAQRTIERGQQAWARLRSDNTWVDWVDVGKAYVIGRQQAMAEAHVNEPSGHRFNDAFAKWRERHGFNDLDKGDRSRLLNVMEHLAEIEAWRATLTTTERMKLNHPSTVLRKWQATKVPTADEEKAKKPSPTEKLEQSIVKLEEENHRLKREIEAGGGDLWNEHDSVDDIAAVMAAKLSSAKFDKLIEAMKRFAKRRMDQSRKRTRDGLPRQINYLLRQGADLHKEAKGLK